MSEPVSGGLGSFYFGQSYPGQAIPQTGEATYTKDLSGSISPSGNLSKSTFKIVVGSILSSGSLKKDIFKSLTGSITPAGSILRSTSKILNGIINPVGNILKFTYKLLSGNLTPTGIVSSSLTHLMFLSGSIIPSGLLKKDTYKLSNGIIIPIGSLYKSTNKNLSGILIPSGDVLKKTFKLLEGSITPTGIVTYGHIFFRFLSGSITPSGSLLKQTRKILRGTIVPSGTLIRQYAGNSIYLSINGVEYATGRLDTTKKILLESLFITESRNIKVPNRCNFTVKGIDIEDGDDIVIRMGNRSNEERLFLGTVIIDTTKFTGSPDNTDVYVDCIDNSRLMNQKPITVSYPIGTNINTIISELMTNAPGITLTGVQSGLGILTEELSFEALSLTECLSQLADRVGAANVYLEPAGTFGDLHFALAEVLPWYLKPSTLISGLATFMPQGFGFKQDSSSRYSRVEYVGAGSKTVVAITIGSTIIPIDDSTPFQSGGGAVRTKFQDLTYTGKYPGTTGSTVVGTTLGVSPPTASVSGNQDGNLGVDGVYTYKISFVGIPGESEISSPSNSITISSIASPGAPGVSLGSSAGRVTPGNHTYKIAFVNANGETLPGNPSSSVNPVNFSIPSAGFVTASGVLGKLLGSYIYVVTYVTSLGETSAGSSFSRTATGVVAPSALGISSGSSIGRLIGTYGYRVTFKTPSGETEGGTIASRTATSTGISLPGAFNINSAGSLGKLIGAYGYRVTFNTTFGETSGGTISSRTASSPFVGTPTVSLQSGMGKLIGTYGYRVTFVSSFGETTGSSAGSRTANAQSAPGALSLFSYNIPGPLVGSYGWKVSFVGPTGKETLGSVYSNTFSAAVATGGNFSVSGSAGSDIAYRISFFHPIYGSTAWSSSFSYGTGNHNIVVNNVPAGCGWRLFATARGAAGSGVYQKIFTSNPGGVTSFLHGSDTGPVEDAPEVALGQYVRFSSGASVIGPTGTVSRKIYRTKSGGSIYYLCGEIIGNSSIDFTDLTIDSALTIEAPNQNLNGEQHSITGIPAGPTGTLSRRIYRTEAGGSNYYRLREIPDNFTSSFIDNTDDSELDKGNSIPLFSTIGEQHSLTSIPMGPTGTLSRRIYRTEAGGSLYRLLTVLGDNSTTSFIDNVLDSTLGGETAPTASASIGETHNLSSIPIGPTGTLSRKIYRTEANNSVYRFLTEINDNFTTTYVDSLPDSSLGAESAPGSSTAGGQIHILNNIPTGITGTLARNIYRTVAGGTAYLFVGQISDNIGTSFTDNVADTDLGQSIPLVNTAGSNTILISSIPTGAIGTLKRKIYRTLADGSDYYLVATINDNFTTSYLDSISDDNIRSSGTPESVSSADGGKVSLSSIPIGPIGTTKRRIWRTTLNGTLYQYVATLNDNITTTYLDNDSDKSLGEDAPLSSMWGGTSGQINLNCADLSQFSNSGWVKVSSQIIKFTSKSGSSGVGTLNGIPSSGVGSILAAIPVDSSIISLPLLTGIPSSGTDAIIKDLLQDQEINLLVIVIDAATEVDLAARLGAGYSIQKATLSDNKVSFTEATARATAYLTLKKNPTQTLMWVSKDKNTRAGRDVPINVILSSLTINDTFKIQTVKISNFTPALAPDFEAVGSNTLYTFEELLRQARDAQSGR